jgi:hypothetical protein
VTEGKTIKSINDEINCVTTKEGDTTCTKGKIKYKLGELELCNNDKEECKPFKLDKTKVPCKSDKSEGACPPMVLRVKSGQIGGDEKGNKGDEKGNKGKKENEKTEQDKIEEIKIEINKRCDDDNECKGDAEIRKDLLKKLESARSTDKDKILNETDSMITKNHIKKLYSTNSIIAEKCESNTEMINLLKGVEDKNIQNRIKKEEALSKAAQIIGVVEDGILREANSITIENAINRRCDIYITECQNDDSMKELWREVRDTKKPAAKEGKILTKATPIIEEIKRVTGSLDKAVKEAVKKMPEVITGLTYYDTFTLSEGLKKVKENMKNMMDEAAKVLTLAYVNEVKAKWSELSDPTITIAKLEDVVKKMQSVVPAESPDEKKDREDAEQLVEQESQADNKKMLDKMPEAVALVDLIKTEAEKKMLRLMGKEWEATEAKMIPEQMVARALVNVKVEELLKAARVKGKRKRDIDARKAKTTLTEEDKAAEDVMQVMRRIAWGAKV